MIGRKTGAAQALGALVAVLSATRTYPGEVRNCPDCEGPVTRCPACGHYHCDDPGCIPPECAQALEEQ